MAVQHYVINMIPGTQKQRVRVSQFDNLQREIEFEVRFGDDDYDLTGKYVTIDGTKSDHTAFSYSVVSDLAGSITGNTVRWKPITQMTILAETINCEMVVWNTQNGSRISSGNFYLEVEPAALNDSTDISATDVSGLLEAMSEFAEQQQSAIEAADDATEAAQNATTELESLRSTLESAVGKIVNYSLAGTVLTITTVDYTEGGGT